MGASGDEAGNNFLVDAPNSLSTSFYFLIGDNAYGFTSAPTNLNVVGDVDVYALHTNIGMSYTVGAISAVQAGYTPGTSILFFVTDALNNIVATGTDFGNGLYGLTFVAQQSEYFVKTYSSSTGFYGVRISNNSITEQNGVGQTVTQGVIYDAALDYASDSDHFLFSAVAGHTYAVQISSAVPDLFLKILGLRGIEWVDSRGGALSCRTSCLAGSTWRCCCLAVG